MERARDIAVDISGISYSIGELERIEEVMYKDDLVRDIRKLAKLAEEGDIELITKEVDWNALADSIERIDQINIDVKRLVKEVKEATVARDKARLEAGICPLCDTDLRKK